MPEYPRAAMCGAPKAPPTCSPNCTVEELDDDWFELTREVLDGTGIEPDDDSAACRWVTLRNQAAGLDIVATVTRQDGRWARLHDDTYFTLSACANFTHDHGLDPSG